MEKELKELIKLMSEKQKKESILESKFLKGLAIFSIIYGLGGGFSEDD